MCMFQMSAGQLKTLLNVACKIIDNACTFLQGVQIVIGDPGVG